MQYLTIWEHLTFLKTVNFSFQFFFWPYIRRFTFLLQLLMSVIKARFCVFALILLC